MSKKYYEMNSTQKMLFLAQDFTKLKQSNNISTLVTLENADVAILAKSAEIAVEKCDAMRLCYDIIDIKKPNYTGYMQYFTDTISDPVKVLDFSDKTEEDMNKVIRSAVNRNLLKPGSRLYRLMVLITPEKKTAIFLAVSCTIMDRWAVNVFLTYVFGIYEAIINNSKMPEPPYPYEKLLEKELESEPEKIAVDAEYWKKEFSDKQEPIFIHPDGREILEKYRKKKNNPYLRSVEHLSHGGKSEIKVFVIPKEIMKKASDYSIKTHLSVQAILSCVLMLRLAAVNKEYDVSVRTVVTCRSTKEEKNSLGARIHYQPLRMIFSPDMTFAEACTECYLKICGIYRHPNLGHMDLNGIFEQLFGIPYYGTYNTVSLTFLPLPLKFMDKYVKTEIFSPGSASQLFHIYATDDDGSGGLRLYIESIIGCVESNSSERLFNDIIKILEVVLDNPEYDVKNIKDILNI